MSDLPEVVVGLFFLVLPFAGYSWVARTPGHSRGQLVLGATLGGALAGLVLTLFQLVAGAAPWDLLPFALSGTLTGFLIGLAGVVAQALGRWLSQKP